jgi:N-methylhydantoinase A
MSYVISVDVGGTFTDLILFDEDSKNFLETKTPSTPSDQSIGVLEGIRKVCGQAGIDPKEVKSILHGTTVATNAVLEGKGARVGLVVTTGYAEILHLARSYTPGPLAGWIGMIKPDPLAAIEDTVEIDARITADGSILRPLDTVTVEKQLEGLINRGIEALTVCLMNSYMNGEHERSIGEIAHRLKPELPISLSSEVLPEFREYERTLTTVMNSYVKPKMRSYLTSLSERLKEEGSTATLNIVRSDGGLMSVEAAAYSPVHTMLSGPSGGVTGSAFVGRTSGHPDLISFDMGGTSTDVSLTNDGVPRIARDTKIGTYPVKSPSVEVVTIGAGGGSIAHVPLTGALRVGPQSAGADPGPACYGKGGDDPTVTDANVMLGYLPPKLVGGEMSLDVEAARKAVETIGVKLGCDVYQAAKGIIDIVNENMLGAIRVTSVEKGHDPRDYALIALGGAGPLHGNALGTLSGSWPVIVPTMPGVLSALGFLASNVRNEFSKTRITTVSAADAEELAKDLKQLGEAALDWLAQEGVPESQREIDYEVDMRYLRQGFELPISATIGEVRNKLDLLAKRFGEAHLKLYTFDLDSEVEVVNLRAVGIGRVDRISFTKAKPGGRNVDDAIVDADHRAYFDGELVATPIYDRALMDVGHRIEGPAIITQFDSTTLVLPGYAAEIDGYSNIIIRPHGRT